MYEVGDYIVKPVHGVCKIENIMHLSMSVADKNKLYYLLIPLEDPGTKIYVPTDTKDANVRKVMTEEEALALIARIPEIEETWVENERYREQKYLEAVRSCDPDRMIGIIKVTYQRRQQRLKDGKKSTLIDENYLKTAENNLYSELGFALNKDKNEVFQAIAETVQKKEAV